MREQVRSAKGFSERVRLTAAGASLEGDLELPPQARAVVLFPHGRGTNRGPHDEFLAGRLRAAGLGVLLLNLLTAEEADLDARKAAFRFDVGLLAGRLAAATDWLAEFAATRGLPVGYLGAGYVAAAALTAAAKRTEAIGAVVAHDGLAELADYALTRVAAPTLLIGGVDQAHLERFGADDQRVKVVPGAPAPEEVARLAVEWFTAHLHRATG